MVNENIIERLRNNGVLDGEQIDWGTHESGFFVGNPKHNLQIINFLEQNTELCEFPPQKKEQLVAHFTSEEKALKPLLTISWTVAIVLASFIFVVVVGGAVGGAIVGAIITYPLSLSNKKKFLSTAKESLMSQKHRTFQVPINRKTWSVKKNHYRVYIESADCVIKIADFNINAKNDEILNETLSVSDTALFTVLEANGSGKKASFLVTSK